MNCSPRLALTERRNVADKPTAFASFEQKWLAAHPEQAAVAVFLAPDERMRASAFGCLVYELEQAAFAARETQAAAVKLAWWRQELIGACAGNPRHPISALLFSAPRTQDVDSESWAALADGALAMLDRRSATSFADLLCGYGAIYTQVARIESVLFAGNPAQADAIATLWTSSHLLHDLSMSTEAVAQVALPLDLLARHGLTRSLLAQPGEDRAAVLRDYLRMLDEHVETALVRATRATLGRRVRARLDLIAVRHARRTADPLAWLAAHWPASHWMSLWLSWNEARGLARRR